MKNIFFKLFLPIIICLAPALLIFIFFVTSQFILLDDHEVYRLFFKEINFFTAIPDDWLNLYRFRPFYWVLRQLQSILFGLTPSLWYGFNWLLFAISLLTLYSFFINLGFKKYLAIILTWAGLLGNQSIGAWMAYGIQEGLGLTLTSISLLFISKYLIDSRKTHIYWSFLFYCLAFLTKESFAFLIPIFAVLLLFKHRETNVLFYKDFLLYVFGLLMIIPIIIALTLRSHNYRSIIFGSNQAQVLQVDNLIVFLEYVKTNPQIVVSFVLFLSFLLLLLIGRATKHRLILLKIGFLSLLAILFQIVIYSFTEYIAPHYIQPFSLAVVLGLSFVLLFAKPKHLLLTTVIIGLTLPKVFLRTLEYGNGHNYHSRIIHEVEQKISADQFKRVVLVGHRAYDHEKIFSFFKRIYYLYPEKEIVFHQYDGQNNPGFLLDIANEVREIGLDELTKTDLLVIFNPNFIAPVGFKKYNYSTQPIVKKISHLHVWYADAPLVYYWK